jgi:hypothetical protein
MIILVFKELTTQSRVQRRSNGGFSLFGRKNSLFRKKESLFSEEQGIGCKLLSPLGD